MLDGKNMYTKDTLNTYILLYVPHIENFTRNPSLQLGDNAEISVYGFESSWSNQLDCLPTTIPIYKETSPTRARTSDIMFVLTTTYTAAAVVWYFILLKLKELKPTGSALLHTKEWTVIFHHPAKSLTQPHHLIDLSHRRIAECYICTLMW